MRKFLVVSVLATLATSACSYSEEELQIQRQVTLLTSNSSSNGVYIVALKKGADPNGVAKLVGVKARRTYKHAISGFAAKLSPKALSSLLNAPQVTSIEPDRVVHVNNVMVPPPSSQIKPTGIARVGAYSQQGMFLTHIDADIAVMDTGVARLHPDLTIGDGSRNFHDSPGDSHYGDCNGHGTHVAGTIAAKYNDIGVMGVAPGARIHALRVLDCDGFGWISDIVTAIDYVTAEVQRTGGVPFKVVNMSIGWESGVGWSSKKASACDWNCVGCGDSAHEAICRSTRAGVVYVVAAGNEHTDIKKVNPASYDEVITVSAFRDTDGLPGGLDNSHDDTIASFSNYGDGVDVLAPGVGILSTWLPAADGTAQYAYLSGTSMAAPHVAGAAARFIVNHPGIVSDPWEWTDRVKNWLRDVGDHRPCGSGVVCTKKDQVPLLNLANYTECYPTCYDADPCTKDLCLSRNCYYPPIPNCETSSCKATGGPCLKNKDCCSGKCMGSVGSSYCN